MVALVLICISAPRAQDRQLSTLNQKIDDLENRVNELTTTVIPQMEKTLDTMVRSKAQTDSATILVINRIHTLQNKIKILEDRMGYADSTNLEILEQLMMIENKIVTLTRSFNELYGLRSGQASPRGTTLSRDEYRNDYVQALNRYQNGDFEQAIRDFTRLVQVDPAHELADNSQYWLGESYYSLRNYKRAIAEFKKVLRFTDDDKWDDAQLKLGLCYKSIGNAERAREEFQKLLDHFPSSEYTEKARRYLQQL
ncbi:MAG: tol-pal system YbgF family protein [Fidelibacterota bacterium]